MKKDLDQIVIKMEYPFEDHEIGNIKCDGCWQGYPIHCECGGLIHAEFGDENYDGDYWLDTKCDKCGDSE